MSADARRPRILIGIPCYHDVGPEVLDDYMRFAFHLGRRLPQYDFELGIKTKSEQFRARNAIVDGALQLDCDWILMLDDDMIFNVEGSTGPNDCYGFLEKLIAHDKDICGVLYYQKQGACAPVLMKRVDEKGYRFLRDDEIAHGLQQVDVAGGGCLLIKSKIFGYLGQPYFAPEFEYGTDVQLCRRAAEKGFTIWADTSIEFGHLKAERAVITSRNRHVYQLEDQLPGEAKTSFISAALYDDLVRDVLAYTGYHDFTEISAHARSFLEQHDAFVAEGRTDLEWYRTYPKERVARQTWFNVGNRDKRRMTETIINSIDHRRALDILDFGCGIGIPAFAFAQRGHRVTALDLEGTGTLAFLRWRAIRANLPLTIHESRSDVPPLGDARFDVIVAMDCLEHIPAWRDTLRELARHLRVGGYLFANNAILNDEAHPEHYPLSNKDFITACMASDLMPVNQITYWKRHADGAFSVPMDVRTVVCA